MKNSFFLVIPKQQVNADRLKEYEPQAMEYWLDMLPTANPRLATRLVRDFIVSLNEIKMPAQLRLDTLETLRPTLQAIEDYLRARLIKTGFPKEENDVKILNTLVLVEKEFTISYWTALKELTQREIGWFQGGNTALAAQRTIKGLSSIVISHFIMGMPVPDWVWLDLHSLYKLSVKIKKESTKVDNDVNQLKKPTSPEECYFQILLLSLADPTGLMQKEIQLVYDFAGRIASLISLKPNSITKQNVQCAVLVDEDRSPFYVPDNQIVDSESTIRYVDFSRLFEAFKDKKAFISMTDARFSSLLVEKSIGEKPSSELFDYLQQRWSGASLQGEPLFSDRLDRAIAIGFEATYALQNPLSSDDEKEVEILAQSESERLLSCLFRSPNMLSVGSLVSFRKLDAPDHLRMLAIVDKIIVMKQIGKIHFGLQLLATHSFAITYSLIDVNDRPKRALFYALQDLVERNYIIVNSFLLKDGDVIRLFIEHQNFLVDLKNRKNIGLGYWQFECFKVIEDGMGNTTYDFI